MNVTNPIAEILARRVTHYRKASGWTMADLAREAKLSKTYVSRIEAAYYDRPSLDRVVALARALRVRVADLTEQQQPLPASLRAHLIDRLGLEDGPAIEALVRVWPGFTEAQRAANVRVIRALLPPPE